MVRLRDIAVMEACNQLNRNEKMLAAAVGTYQCRAPGRAAVRNGVLLATNRRVVFCARRHGGYDMDAYRYEDIVSITAGKTWLGRVITLVVDGDEIKVTGIRRDVEPLVETVTRKLRPAQGEGPEGSQASPLAP